MALAPNNSDNFMREVDDAVREDLLRTGFARFGRPIIALVVVGLIAFAGWLFWQNNAAQEAGARGRAFTAALDAFDQARPKAAIDAAAPFARGDDPAYRAAALMVQGNAATAQDDLRTAAARFGAVANDSGVPQAVRDVALLRQTLAEFDTLAPEAVVARLRGLVAQPDSAAFPSAAELTALAEMRRGNDQVARRLFQQIAEADGVADSLKSRATQMASMLAAPAGARPAAAAPTAAPRPAAAPNPAPRGPATKE